jgi:hypothetical protein
MSGRSCRCRPEPERIACSIPPRHELLSFLCSVLATLLLIAFGTLLLDVNGQWITLLTFSTSRVDIEAEIT